MAVFQMRLYYFLKGKWSFSGGMIGWGFSYNKRFRRIWPSSPALNILETVSKKVSIGHSSRKKMSNSFGHSPRHTVRARWILRSRGIGTEKKTA
jgi:hypothetical protein